MPAAAHPPREPQAPRCSPRSFQSTEGRGPQAERQKLRSEGGGGRRNPRLRCWGRLGQTCIQRMDTPHGNAARDPRSHSGCGVCWHICASTRRSEEGPPGGGWRGRFGAGIPVFKRHGNTRQILTCFLLFPTENYWAPSPRYTCGRVERTLASEDLGPRPGLAPAS